MERKRSIPCLMALALMVLVHLRPGYAVTVEGRELPGLYSPQAVARAGEAAQMALEELSPGRRELPELEKELRLSLSPPMDDGREIGRALVAACPELVLCQGVYVDGRYLGSVLDGPALLRALREHIDRTLPTWARTGYVSGLELREQFSPAGRQSSTGDMLLLICGASPVLYSDLEGYVSRV